MPEPAEFRGQRAARSDPRAPRVVRFEDVTNLLTSFTKNSFGYDYGFGINVYFPKTVGVRGDMRKMRTFGDVPLLGNLTAEEKLEFWRASVGLALRF